MNRKTGKRDGAKHLYRVKPNGKLQQITNQSLLEAYGYSPEDTKQWQKLKKDHDKSLIASPNTQIDDIDQAIIPIPADELKLSTSGLAAIFITAKQSFNSLRSSIKESFSHGAVDKEDVEAKPDKKPRGKLAYAALGALVLAMASTTAVGQDSAKNAAAKQVRIPERTQPASHIGIPTIVDGRFKVHLPAKSQGNSKPVTFKTSAAKPAISSTHTEKLSFSNDTVWAHASNLLEHRLGHEPSNSQIQKLTAAILKLNHISWPGARHMRLGQTFKVFNK